MHYRGFALYLIPTWGFMSFASVAKEPQGQFWILRASNETADPLVEAVESKKFPPAELVSKITALIEGQKIQQLARFDQMLGKDVFKRRNLTGEMRYPDSEEKIDLGAITMTKPSMPS